MDAVTNVLQSRGQSPRGLDRMVAFSVGGHVVLGLLLLLMPAVAARDEAPRTVMTISLGGAPGPNVGGMTTMGGRRVDETPPEPTPRPVPPEPPAKAPEMAYSLKKSSPPPKPSAGESRPAPAVQAPPQPGNTPVDTGARGVGFGLTTGGGGTGGYLDVGNFCCPEYLSDMLQLIQRNWNSRQDVPGESLVQFTILRDGRLTGVELERSSGYAALDLTAQRAVLTTRQLPPLPARFTENHLRVHLIFRYTR